MKRRLERLERLTPKRSTGQVDIWEHQPDGRLHCARTGETLTDAEVRSRPDMQIIVTFSGTGVTA